MMRILSLLFIGIIFFSSISAQEKLSNSFTFNNGIYASYEEFKNNQPSILWSDVHSDLIVLEKLHKSKIGNVVSSKDSSDIELENIWGFTVKGVPYKKVLEKDENGFYEFSGIQIRGKICYYEYEETILYPVEVAAYNPLTGKAFRKKTVMREKVIINKRIMNFSNGKSELFNMQNVRDWIANDEELSLTLQEAKYEEKISKLLKYIQIYNDRNPIIIQ